MKIRALAPVILGLAACGGTEQTATPPAPTPVSTETPTTAPTASSPSLTQDHAQVHAESLAGITFDLPETWVAETPSSSMRLAQMRLPGEAGDAELAVFCFGVGQGGPIQANIDRWLGQFSNPDAPGMPVESITDSTERNGLTVHTVTAQGTHTPGMGPMMAPGDPLPGYALYGVIVEGGTEGTVFVKITGPEATIDAHRSALEAFAASARR
ncbi:hypothetical protein JXA47_01610 [Candidatus Sumerlaeota bacterium]|nr:hypothetical protein [Candidatus Sumerlaeota bacterium]